MALWFVCPNCGRRGSLPDGTKLPAKVGCRACGAAFAPQPIVEDAAAGRAISTATRSSAPVEIPLADQLPAQPPPLRARPVAIETTAVTTKLCEYCSEPIQAAAKKCRHCGEILDPALRSAEEAKRIALSGGNTPIVVNNNVSSSASAAAVATGVQRRSLVRQFYRFLLVCGLLIVGGLILGLSSGPDSVRSTWGMGIFVLGLVLFLLGTPLFLLRGVLKFIFG